MSAPTQYVKVKCKICGETDISAMAKESRRLSGYGPRCRKCMRLVDAKNREKLKIRSRMWRKNNPERQRSITLKGRLKREFGMTPDEVYLQYQKQNGLCALCLRPMDMPIRNGKPHGDRPGAMDHNHVTGKFRGIIHQRCNTLLGLANDDVFMLELAKTYLVRNQ